MEKTLISFLLKTLSPIVRILIKYGIPFRNCVEIMKWVYINEGYNTLGENGKKATATKVSHVTGIRREDVNSFKVMDEPGKNPEALQNRNKVVTILTKWNTDPEFSYKSKNEAKTLSLDEDLNTDLSFRNLCKKYGQEHYRASLIKTLIDAGCAKITDDGKIKCLRSSYIPQEGLEASEEKVRILSKAVSRQLNTGLHNLNHIGKDDFFQQTTFTDFPILKKDKKKLLVLSTNRCIKFFKQLEKECLQKFEVIPDNKNSELLDSEEVLHERLGFGLFYFEEDL
jgi:hypothetical protein